MKVDMDLIEPSPYQPRYFKKLTDEGFRYILDERRVK